MLNNTTVLYANLLQELHCNSSLQVGIWKQMLNAEELLYGETVLLKFVKLLNF